MTTPYVLEVTATIEADVTAVWAALGDSSTWPEWTSIDSYEQIEPAGPGGTGEIRLFRNGRYKIVEQVTEWVPERRVSYTLLSGLAVREYLAVVDLAPLSLTTTSITWHTEFEATFPGTGWLYRLTLQKFTREFVNGLTEWCTRGETGAAR